MAGSFNSVTLVGNVGKDPEIKSFQNGGKIANFSIATSESWKDRTTGEKKERTDWHNVSVKSDGLVGIVERYVKKGSKVLVQGQLQTRKWQDQAGADRYTTEIVLSGFNGTLTLLDRREGEGRSEGRSESPRQSSQGNGAGGYSRGFEDLDDDAPFVTAYPAHDPLHAHRRVM